MGTKTMAITTYCPKCGWGPAFCECKDAPAFICGTCGKNVDQCTCEEPLKRCFYCSKFSASYQTNGFWVCPHCLEDKAVRFDLGVQP